MIRRRDKQRVLTEGERQAHELWVQSVKRYHEKRRDQNRWEWMRHFDRMAECHARLSESYRERAEELCESEAKEGD